MPFSINLEPEWRGICVIYFGVVFTSQQTMEIREKRKQRKWNALVRWKVEKTDFLFSIQK